METLRLITCGSVADGKSTLIEHLQLESKAVFDNQLGSPECESGQYGNRAEKSDLALPADSLQVEFEQGITTDLTYRVFATDRRRYIVADTPGQEHYTRNVATGGSTADLAVILVDARKGVLVQTRRHSRIVAMMGIRHMVLAVNKMDLVDFAEATFNAIVADYRAFAARLEFASIQAIPLSALNGDNVLQASGCTPWYCGPTLTAYLDTVDVRDQRERAVFRMPVQLVEPSQPRLSRLLRARYRRCDTPGRSGVRTAVGRTNLR